MAEGFQNFSYFRNIFVVNIRLWSMQGCIAIVSCSKDSPSPKDASIYSFDEVTQHYLVIADLTVAMAKRYVCEACNKGCKFGDVHLFDQKCSDCIISPP